MLSKFVYLITIDEVLILLPSGMGSTGIEKRSIRIRPGISDRRGLVDHNCKPAAQLREVDRPAICGTTLGWIGRLRETNVVCISGDVMRSREEGLTNYSKHCSNTMNE